MPLIVLTHCIALPPSLLCRHFLIIMLGGFHRIQNTLASFLTKLSLWKTTDYEECVCSTVKLPTLQVLMYLKDHSQ